MDTILRASTDKLLHGNINQCINREDSLHNQLLLRNTDSLYSYPPYQSPRYVNEDYNIRHNVISQLEWLPDGGSFVSITEDLGIRLFIAPSDLLQKEKQDLSPFIRSYQYAPISAFCLHLSASIYNGFCGSLLATNNLPLKLLNLIPNDEGKSQLIKTFNIQDQHTERYNKIFSLTFTSDVQFLAGGSKSVYLFDINRNDPLLTIPTSNGITSCLTVSNSDLLPSGTFFTGTFSNKVQMHDPNGTVVNSVSLEKGNGISQIIESINGRYLFCISRNSSSIKMLDLRMGLLPAGELESFSSRNQRITGEMFPDSKGLLVGTSDGFLNWYRDSELGLPSIDPVKLSVNSETSLPFVRVNKQVPSLILTGQGDRSYQKPRIDISEISLL
jgi:hypothetical protein